RMLVEERALIPQIIGADDGRVAPGIAATEPPFLEHGDIGDPMLLGEIVRRRQSVAASADDDDVVLRLRLWAAPGELPVLVIIQRVARETEDRIAGSHETCGCGSWAREPAVLLQPACRGARSNVATKQLAARTTRSASFGAAASCGIGTFVCSAFGSHPTLRSRSGLLHPLSNPRHRLFSVRRRSPGSRLRCLVPRPTSCRRRSRFCWCPIFP